MRCKGCGLAFLDPPPSAQELNEVYEGSYYHRDPRYADYLRRQLSGPIKRLLPAGRVLDVGVGAGEFLAMARFFGYEAEGIETSPAAAGLCRDAGLPVTEVELPDFDAPPDSFDCVTMWDVIEHLPQPRHYLESAKRLLRPGGLLVIKTPDVQPTIMAMARALSTVTTARAVLGYPAHLLYFDRPSLTALLESSGFEILEAHQIGSIRTASPRRLTGRVYGAVLGVLIKARLGGNLLFYARKVEPGAAVTR